MYSWIFRHLPGPLWIRIIQTLLLLAFLVLVLMNFVFPWANQFSPWNESTIDASGLLPDPARATGIPATPATLAAHSQVSA